MKPFQQVPKGYAFATDTPVSMAAGKVGNIKASFSPFLGGEACPCMQFPYFKFACDVPILSTSNRYPYVGMLLGLAECLPGFWSQRSGLPT